MALALAALIWLSAVPPGLGDAGAEPRRVELFAVNVGKGDALILRVDGWTGLIDAGKARAEGSVRAALDAMGVTVLDAVFLTHTDGDHAGGLKWLAKSDIPVGAWYASAMYTGVKPNKRPAEKAAKARDMDVTWLRRGDVVALGDTGAALRVLAPSRLFEEKDDDNSLVMMLETDEGRMLLTGDMELPEEALLLDEEADLGCVVLKVPNHADDDTVSTAFARAASPAVAIVSTSSEEKPGTPDPGVVARLEAAGAIVHVTQDAGLGLRMLLKGGEATVEYVDAPPDGNALRDSEAFSEP